jgi:hypothetical protein
MNIGNVDINNRRVLARRRRLTENTKDGPLTTARTCRKLLKHNGYGRVAEWQTLGI